MKAKTLSLFTLTELFPAKENAVFYFERMRWDKEVNCSKCGCCKKLKRQKDGFNYWCGECRSYFNVFTNTPLERNKIDPRKWLFAGYLLLTSRNGMNSLQLSKELSIKQATAWYMIHRLRSASIASSVLLSDAVEKVGIPLGRLEKYKHSTSVQDRKIKNKTTVADINQKYDKVLSKFLNHIDSGTLQDYIDRNFNNGKLLTADKARFYKLIKGYAELRVNHSVNECVNGMASTTGIESSRRLLTRSYHDIINNFSKEQISRYINECTFRYNEAKCKIDKTTKKRFGQYYTAENPFDHVAFHDWVKKSKLPKVKLLEPFAGSNSIVRILLEMGLCKKYVSYDISPANAFVQYKDTIKNFPKGYDVCITNPPWLAKNIATYKGIEFPRTSYDNLYKLCLEKCLGNCKNVAILLPESFIRSGLFRDRLTDFISITSSTLFTDTNNPVGLALFGKSKTTGTNVWSNDFYTGELSELQKLRPLSKKGGASITFNAGNGNVGLIALDNTIEASIRFCDIDELSDYKVKPTGRHITKIKTSGDVCINDWNNIITNFRDKTKDILMTSYKGLRRDGMYRRRCDWALAKGVMHYEGQA